MFKKDMHEKLIESVQQMLIDTKVNLPYYGNFNLFITFSERKDIDTCAVNMTASGMNFFFNAEFLDRLTQKEVNFITLHEDFHLLWSHPRRTITGQYDHKLSNIAQDMIINHIIWEDIPSTYVEIPKDKDGKNMALFIPKEYTGKLIFEEVYEWLREEKEKREKEKKQNQCQSCDGSGKDKQKQEGQSQDKSNSGGKDKQKQEGQDKSDGEDCQECSGSGQQDGQGQGEKPKYGPFGKNPKNEKETIDTWSLDQILDNLENNQGQYLDVHMGDEIPEEMRESMVRDAMDRLQARGLSSGGIETTLNKLRKQRKDYLKEIKRTISNLIFGTKKEKTIKKPNRKGIQGVKGNRKVKTKINVGLDTSGSMGGQGTFERVLSYVYQNDIEINFMESDTQVNWVEKIKSKKQLESIPIKGLGGTCLNPMIEYIVEHHNDCASVLLTDGYTDALDFSKVKCNVLIISVGVPCPIAKSNGKVKQICIENTH
jgi:predicted metal-dependent peptidase